MRPSVARQRVPDRAAEGAAGLLRVRPLRGDGQRQAERQRDDRRRRPRGQRHRCVAVELVVASRGDVSTAACSRSTSTASRPRRCSASGSIVTSTERAQDRRQRDLGRVVQRADRRGSGVQPGADARRDPGRHGAAGDQSGCGAPSAPGVLSASGGLSSAVLSWGAASDNVGVVRYNVHRGTRGGVCAVVGEPGWAAGGDEVHRLRVLRRAATSIGSVLRMRPGMWVRSRTRRRRRSGTRRRRRAGAGWARSGRSGGRACPGRRSTDNVACAALQRPPRHERRLHAQPRRTGSRSRPGPATSTTPVPGSYFYKVTAEDAAGNISPASNEAAATVTADTTAPTIAGRAGRDGDRRTANLTWTASTDDVAVSRYNLHRGTSAGFTPSPANRIAQPTGTSYADTGLATGSYLYKVTAEDAAGNTSAASNEATATVADATPPSAPGTLTATATGSTINLSWGAATDNVAVSRYNLHRGTTSGFTPTAANRIAQPTGLSYADTGLAPGSYFYKLTAEDAAGNIGPLTNTATATVLDTSPPSTPTLNATGGAGQASLTWTAATDNVAVTRYNLHRSTTSGFTPSPAQPDRTTHRHQPHRHRPQPPAPTTTNSPPKTPPATKAPPQTKPPPPSPPHPSPASSPPTASTPAPAPPSPTNPAPATTAPPPTPPGPAPPQAATATPSPSTAPTPPPPSPTPASLDLTTGMTLEAWVRPTNLGNSLPHGADEGAARQHGVRALRQRLRARTACRSARSTSPATGDAIGTAQLPSNTWTHLATTYNGNVLALYVNGVQAGQLLDRRRDVRDARARSRSAATRSGANGSRATSTKSASTTAPSPPPRSRPT